MSQGNRTQTGGDTPIAINGYALQAIRELSGLKRPALARAANVSASYIAKIEEGVRINVDPAIVTLLANALNVKRFALLASPHAEQVAA